MATRDTTRKRDPWRRIITNEMKNGRNEGLAVSNDKVTLAGETKSAGYTTTGEAWEVPQNVPYQHTVFGGPETPHDEDGVSASQKYYFQRMRQAVSQTERTIDDTSMVRHRRCRRIR